MAPDSTCHKVAPHRFSSHLEYLTPSIKRKEKQVKLMDISSIKTMRGNERLQAMINNNHHEEVQLRDRSRSSTQEGGFIDHNQQAKA